MDQKAKGRGLFFERAQPQDRISLRPTDRQLRWMQFLNLHGALPSQYLFDLEGEKSVGQRRTAQHYLLRLWRGGFIYRPKQQRATENANYHHYVYDLTEEGRKCLERKGLLVAALRPTGPWPHQLFVSCVTATIDIWCQRSGYRYIPPHQYLAGKPIATSVPFAWEDGERSTTLVPDAVFAIDYGRGSYVAYALEADRNTEPHKHQSWRRKSDRRAVRQYASLIGRGLYKRAYERDAMMVLLYVTVAEPRARAFLRTVTEEVGPCPYIAAGVVPEMDVPFRPPLLLSHLFNGRLERAGKDPFTVRQPA
jgi:hypothetical protein